jgi:hypothetical protein
MIIIVLNILVDTDLKSVAYDQWKSIVAQAKEYLQEYFSTDVDSCAFISLYEVKYNIAEKNAFDINAI